ncbi:uncharacterized protein LOC129608399, partial [Condylostylus longicornis]|uniref:uncharacterized protein LOC129608399 n=1 Tax=Condylostylus longicornis TaxID=2530218 RepID=UPI00244D9CB2
MCTSKCFTGNFNKELIRGCFDDLNDTDRKLCINGSTCILCNTEKNCNHKVWPQCYSCISDSKDLNCVQWYSQNEINKEICNTETDKCLIQINSESKTERKCIPNDYKCKASNPDLCYICSENLCNQNIFPKDRLHCHQCSSNSEENNCDILQEIDKMKPCLLYKKNDKCFLYSEGGMKRGCISDIKEYEKCKESPDTCRICNNENGCNSLSLYQKPKLSCSICGMSNECAWHQKNDTIKKCK